MEKRELVRLAFITVLMGTLTGCVSQLDQPPCTRKYTIRFEIDATGETTPRIDDKEVDVCKNNQDVEWFARGAQSMRVTVLDVPEARTPGGPQGKVNVKEAFCEADASGTGYLCKLSKKTHVADGWVCYKIDLRDANGTPQLVDPYLIIRK
jgi:hypothetical protein